MAVVQKSTELEEEGATLQKGEEKPEDVGAAPKENEEEKSPDQQEKLVDLTGKGETTPGHIEGIQQKNKEDKSSDVNAAPTGSVPSEDEAATPSGNSLLQEGQEHSLSLTSATQEKSTIEEVQQKKSSPAIDQPTSPCPGKSSVSLENNPHTTTTGNET